MKRPSYIVALALTALIGIALYLRPRAHPSVTPSAADNGTTNAAIITPPSQTTEVAPETSDTRPPRPGSIAEYSAHVAFLTEGIQLEMSQYKQLDQFLDSYRVPVYDRFAAIARIEMVADKTCMASVTVPPAEVEAMRKECYEGVAAIIGSENLQLMIARNKIQILDGGFDDFGALPFSLTANMERDSRPYEFVEFRTDRKKMIGGEPADTFTGGTLFVADFKKRYGALGVKMLETLGQR